MAEDPLGLVLLVESGEWPSLGRPEASCCGRGELPSCSGDDLGCVGAAGPQGVALLAYFNGKFGMVVQSQMA